MSVTQSHVDDADTNNSSSLRKEPMTCFDEICLDLGKELGWETGNGIVIPDGYVAEYLFWSSDPWQKLVIKRDGTFCTGNSRYSAENMAIIGKAAVKIAALRKEEA